MKRVILGSLVSFVAYSSEMQNHSILIKHTNSSIFAPTQVDYADILGKDSLLNSGDIANSFLQIPGFSGKSLLPWADGRRGEKADPHADAVYGSVYGFL